MGVSTFPTLSISFEGLSAIRYARRKYIALNTNNGSLVFPVTGAIPIEKDVLAVLGIAKKGPIAR